MRFFAAVLLAVSMVLPAIAAPSPLHTVQKYDGETTGKYIVQFKSGASRKTWIKKLKLTNKVVDWDILNGFGGKFITFYCILRNPDQPQIGDIDAATLNELRASEDVESIHEDGIMYALSTVTQYVFFTLVDSKSVVNIILFSTRTNAPWGLQRISQDAKLSSTSTRLVFKLELQSNYIWV